LVVTRIVRLLCITSISITKKASRQGLESPNAIGFIDQIVVAAIKMAADSGSHLGPQASGGSRATRRRL
jgi:hypothetical protein